MNILRVFPNFFSCLQIRRCFYSVSSSLIGPPPEGIGLNKNDNKIAEIYEENKLVLGNHVHAVIKDTIGKYQLLTLDKTILAKSEGLSDIDKTIKNLVIEKSNKVAKKS